MNKISLQGYKDECKAYFIKKTNSDLMGEFWHRATRYIEQCYFEDVPYKTASRAIIEKWKYNRIKPAPPPLRAETPSVFSEKEVIEFIFIAAITVAVFAVIIAVLL